MRHASLCVLFVGLLMSSISNAQRPTSTLFLPAVTFSPLQILPGTAADTTNTSSSSVACNGYAQLVVGCQPEIPATVTAQAQTNLLLLKCLCNATNFYTVYTQCTATMNLTVWDPMQFATYCQYISNGNVTLLPNDSPSGNTTMPPIIITVVTYTAPPETKTTEFISPTATADSAESGASVIRLSQAMLIARTLLYIGLSMLVMA